MSSQKQPSFLLNGEVIWQASDYSLAKELYALANPSTMTPVKLAISAALVRQLRVS